MRSTLPGARPEPAPRFVSSKITVLSEQVIGRIAAGEVVERPAAVVKELLENSLDAGARVITVDIADGGLGRIRVRDDGEGMSRADAELAFQRHATSKLRDDGDLARIGTMGFRGEALPSIAAVAEVRTMTACRHETTGTGLRIRAGRIEAIEDVPAVLGTYMEVTDLFFNTPARRKFLKSPGTEFSHICLAAQHAALAHPGIHVKLSHNGQVMFDYSAVPTLRDRLLQVYGATLIDQMVEVSEERGSMRVTGWTLRAVHARTGRSPQELFVNRRPIKNAAVQHAMYDGYGPALPKGRHPAFVLMLDVDPSCVDVNVHPTKREVRFADQDQIHQLVRQAIRRTVGQEPAIASWPTVAGERHADAVLSASPTIVSEPPSPPYQELFSDVDSTATGPDIIPLGQLHRTFLVAQVGTELLIVDQHTAHERVLYERLCRAWKDRKVETQPLLIPQPIDVPPSQAVALRQHLTDLGALGLELEPFGAHAFVLRAAPAVLGQLDTSGLIADLLEDLTQWRTAESLDRRVQPIFASLACHAAVRAGRPMHGSEIAQLIGDWVAEGMPTTCPHGRRVALRMPAEELLKIFGRA